MKVGVAVDVIFAINTVKSIGTRTVITVNVLINGKFSITIQKCVKKMEMKWQTV